MKTRSTVGPGIGPGAGPGPASVTSGTSVTSVASVAPAAVAGALAAAAGIAVAELAAGLVAGAPSLVIAIGDLAIDLQPPGAKDVVVSLFGTNDKLALAVGIVGLAAVLAAAVGVTARRRPRAGVAGFGVLGLVTSGAALREPLVAPVLAVLVPLGATVVALGVLRLLLSASAPRPLETTPIGASAQGPSADAPPFATPPAPVAARPPALDRRRFLILGGAVAAGSAATWAVGRSLLERPLPGGGGPSSPAGPSTVTLPRPLEPAPGLPAGASLGVPGVTPLVVPADRFYRIDTAILPPRVDAASWTLRVTGMVERETVLSYRELADLPVFEQYVTIACVSNRVGGDLVGNAKWTGVHLRDVLALAGVKAGATQIVGRAVDGFTVGFPTEWAMDPARDPMIALGMNDELLPEAHGYPARLVVPGLYGYVSATKWLAEIELTTLAAFDAYWVRLGWAKEAPILTQSRIDVPHDGADAPAGLVTIAGVAWAPDRGVAAVEVRIDDGPWETATISAAISKAAWIQWRHDWTASSGTHRIEVRATDGAGVIQTADQTDPAPDGARGHHRIEVHVA